MVEDEKNCYFKYWGKSDRSLDSDLNYHLLVYHCLDVAAVGHVLLRRKSIYSSVLSHLTGINQPVFNKWFTFLLALHDVGKFSNSFQNLNPKLLQHLQGCASNRNYSSEFRHDSLGLKIWHKCLCGKLQDKGLLPRAKGSKLLQITKQSPIDFWVKAVFGHHGKPPLSTTNRLLRDDFDDEKDFTAASLFVDKLIEICLPDQPVFPECDIETAKLASWWLSGLAVLCDWVGSNARFFPLKRSVEPLDSYWKLAKKHADEAIDYTGILYCNPSTSFHLSDMIKTTAETASVKLTPMQKFISGWRVSTSPRLFVLEDVTGSGKTEAAIMLVHKLMNASRCNGLYFALPTMATANNMYSRMREPYRKLFAADSMPSLVLAHGSRDLSDDFKQSISAIPEASVVSENYDEEILTAESHCSAWLADNHKKALLADVGVGTIDQALISVLHSRHQSLRLLGLLGKVLVVDEVHACDVYMHRVLCALLHAHAVTGGSAILLSATLSRKQRQELLDSYARGRDWKKPALNKVDEHCYPLATCLSSEGLEERLVGTRESVKREVEVEFVSDLKSVEQILASVVDSNQCACWIRNTVKDAVDAYQWIKKKYPEWEVDLFHARYALGDRLRIEERVIDSFGKESTVSARRKRILIATQVVEQSLDLDFDAMITDLAPVDLIIQRAGRLRRHARNKYGSLIDREDQRGEVKIYIHSPEVVDLPASDWYAGFFRNAQKIYRNHGQLWLTANVLYKRGKFQMPEDARMLIESVYGEEQQENIPEGLIHHSYEAEGQSMADASMARFNTIVLDNGYTEETTNAWMDESRTPTRLGEQTVTVYLARNLNGTLQPWFFDKELSDDKHSWLLSSVSVAAHRISEGCETQGITQEQINECKERLPGKGIWGKLLVLSSTGDVWKGSAFDSNNRRVEFVYSEILGLT